MSDKLIDRIIKRINKGTCAVILGPTLPDTEGKSIFDMLNEHLIDNLGSDASYDEDEKLLNFSEATRNNLVGDEVEDFFDDFEPNVELYKKIAEIPFSMVINTVPDLFLKSIFDQKKEINALYDYYNKSDPEEPLRNTGARYVYNIFGDHTDLDSMILTNKDLYEYVQSIATKVGKEIKKTLQEAEAILFLGFGFDKWYFKLLLWLLDIEGKLLQSHDIEQGSTKNYFMEEYQMKFLEHEPDNIIEKLYEAKKAGLIKERESKEFYGEMYLSYAWGGESEEMAKELVTTMQGHKIKLIRDKEEMTYKDNIMDFMNDIGSAEGVVAIISDKYLKSKYCMYELTQIYNAGDFENRLFPIVLDDAKMYDTEGVLERKNYWNVEMQKLEEGFNDKAGDAIGSIGDELKRHQEIHYLVDKVLNKMAPLNTYTAEMHREDNYNDLISQVKDALNFTKKEKKE